MAAWCWKSKIAIKEALLQINHLLSIGTARSIRLLNILHLRKRNASTVVTNIETQWIRCRREKRRFDHEKSFYTPIKQFWQLNCILRSVFKRVGSIQISCSLSYSLPRFFKKLLKVLVFKVLWNIIYVFKTQATFEIFFDFIWLTCLRWQALQFLILVNTIPLFKSFCYADSTNVTMRSLIFKWFSQNGLFSWDPAKQGLVLGCYFYGYIVSNIPGAWLARRFGFKLVLGISMLLSSFLTLCTPAAAVASFELFLVLRIILGFLQVIHNIYCYKNCITIFIEVDIFKVACLIFSECQISQFSKHKGKSLFQVVAGVWPSFILCIDIHNTSCF